MFMNGISMGDEEYKWSLPESMAEYVKENFENFIPEKNVKEAVLVPNPRPDNLVPAKEFLSDLMKERKKYTELALEATLEKVQNKNLDVMGPLTRLWLAVEKVNNHKEGESDDPPPQLLVHEAQQLIEQTVLMLGQSHNFLLCERRKNVMSCVMTANAVSSTLKDKADDLASSGKLLFGNEFRDHMVDTSKAKRMEAFSAAPPAKKPFRGGPSGSSYKTAFRQNSSAASYSRGYEHGGQSQGGRSYPRGSRSMFNNNQRRTNGKFLFTRKTALVQHHSVSTTNELGGVNSSSHVNKTHVSTPKNSKRTLSGKNKEFSPSMGNAHSGQENAVHSKRFSNSFLFRPYTKEITFSRENKPRTGTSSRRGGARDVAEGCHYQSRACTRGISEQCLSGAQKG